MERKGKEARIGRKEGKKGKERKGKERKGKGCVYLNMSFLFLSFPSVPIIINYELQFPCRKLDIPWDISP